MAVFKRCFVFVFSACMLSLVLSAGAWGWQWSKPKPKPKPVTNPTKAQIIEQKKKETQYIRSHDLNNDGKVTVKDRLLWLKGKKDDGMTIYISEENEDLCDDIDADGDGDVEQWEIQRFYSEYDLNKDGVVQDEEIEAATD